MPPSSSLNILLLCIGSAGDVHPFVGMGKELKARGHRVTVITSAYFETLVRSVGLDFSAISTAEEYLELTRDSALWHRTRAWQAVFRSVLDERLRLIYEKVEQLHEPGRTVLVMSSLALAGRCAQERLNIPGATVHLSPAVIRSSIAAPKLGGVWMPSWLPAWMKQRIWQTGDARFVDPFIGPSLNAFRAELGLPPVSRILDQWWNSPDRVLGLWPDFFAPPQTDWPSQLRLTGFPLYDEGDLCTLSPQLSDFLKSGDSPVAFTAGSAMFHAEDYFARAVDTCRIMGRRGLLITRRRSQLPAQLPQTIQAVEYAPFSQLFQKCAAVVHHGGIGTTAQALAAGVPQLVMPWAHDQFDNAARVTKLGVGDSLNPRRFRPWVVAKVLRNLCSSDRVAAACKLIAPQVSLTRGLQKAVDEIEQLAPPPPSSARPNSPQNLFKLMT